MNVEVNHLQKQVVSLTEELDLYKDAEHEIEVKYRELVLKFETVEEMYRRTRTELDEMKDSSQWTIKKLETENGRIRQEISVLRGKAYFPIEVVSVDVQTDKVAGKGGKGTSQERV